MGLNGYGVKGYMCTNEGLISRFAVNYLTGAPCSLRFVAFVIGLRSGKSWMSDVRHWIWATVARKRDQRPPAVVASGQMSKIPNEAVNVGSAIMNLCTFIRLQAPFTICIPTAQLHV